MKSWSIQLTQWYRVNKRELPWRETKNAYFIWLSEVILQQTRVQQGLPYYERFVHAFPQVSDLANAPLETVLNHWQGLGYYSRARNLHQAAKQIVDRFGGVFPSDYKHILSLQGVGPYTAAAIASFAFDSPHAVVDGNVYRVLSRYFGIHEAIDSGTGQRVFAALANELLDANNAGEHNQAIMEFGALQCLPIKPKCDECIFKSSCAAYARDLVHLLPVKVGKIKQRERHFNYVVLQNREGLYMRERLAKDIWQHLWEFEMIETESLLDHAEIILHLKQKFSISSDDFYIRGVSEAYKHILTHQKLVARFWQVQIFSNLQSKELIFVPYNQLDSKPLPRLIDKYLKKTQHGWIK